LSGILGMNVSLSRPWARVRARPSEYVSSLRKYRTRSPYPRAMAALPLQVYVYAVGPYDEWHRQAWAGALVLILLVLALSLVARGVVRARRPHG
jgi:ABC-type phosphate transport system permease subunit